LCNDTMYMKKCLIIPVLLLVQVKSAAQYSNELPGFGKIEKEEMELTKCPFEENAPAMVLFDEGVSVFRIYGNALNYGVYRQTKYRIRIKIFNKKGFDYANVKIKYYTPGKIMTITNLRAQTCNSDAAGNITVEKVEKSSIYDHKINKRYSEKVFAFPAVKEGSIIEYEYTLDNISERAWYFQKSIPVMLSRFTADFSPELEIGIVPNVSLPFAVQTNKRGINNISTYSMEKIPSFPDEPLMTCPEDYLQRIQVKITAADFRSTPGKNLVPTWPDIIKELMADEDFGVELKKSIPHTEELDMMLKTATDPYQKLLRIHKYVTGKMECDDYYGIWTLNGVRSAWKNKRGTGGEINLILISLLRDAGLGASPILVSTRQNGFVNTEIPDYNQYDKVMAYVEIGDRFYILDATNKITPSNMIPAEVLASKGLVINCKPADTYEYGWQYLEDDRHQYKKMVAIDAAIDDKHQMNAGAIVAFAGYARLNLAPVIKQGDDALKYSLALQPGIITDSQVLINRDVDTLPLEQKFRFSMPVSGTGDYHYFSLNLFAGLENNPFTADRRQSDIFFGYNQQYNINCAVSLPAGYEIDVLPKNIKIITPDTSLVFTRMCFYGDNILTVRMSLEFRKNIYPASQYNEVKEVYKKLFGMLNEKYVYKKVKA
jgi:Domain of Unknown Function with PDB structure (DUF3857)